MRKAICVGVLFLGLGFASLSAYADTVPGVQFNGVLDGSTVLTKAGTASMSPCSLSGCSPVSMTLSYAGGEASASIQGNSPAGGWGTTALGSVTFFFVVEGNYKGEVPLVASGVSNLSVSGLEGVPDYGAWVTSTFTADSNWFAGGQLSACLTTYSVACGSTPTHFANGGTIDFDMLSYSSDTNPGEIEVQIQGYSYDGTYKGMVDPVISFAPSFLATAEADGLSIVMSPGPVTTSPTPEPGTFVLLGSGLLGFLPAIRRRLAAPKEV
jgi:hypothetical protein